MTFPHHRGSLAKTHVLKIRSIAVLALLGICLPLLSALAQPSIMRSSEEKKQLNLNRVGLATGVPTGTYSRMGADLATLLNDPTPTNPFRLVVSISQGSVNNLDDLLNLERIDVAIVQSDVLEAFRSSAGMQEKLAEQLRFIAPLHQEEIHILARGDIGGPDALTGRIVNIGAPTSGTQITARNLFRRLGVRPTFDERTTLQARDALMAGEIDAMVFVVGKESADVFRSIRGEDAVRLGLRFVPLGPQLKDLEQYLSTELTSSDYPSIIPQGQSVPTRAVRSIMAVYAWTPQNNPARYAATRQFVERFFERAPRLVTGGFSKSWCQVDLASKVAYWEQFKPAAEWLQQRPGSTTRLCQVSGSQCPCNSCEDRFLVQLRAQGMDIKDIKQPMPQQLYQQWKRDHPECA